MNDLLWIEKYRPQKLEQLALSPENRTMLWTMIQKGEIPHLLLLGPPGIGKTALSQILIKELDCAVLSLNASASRGIDVVREQISMFARSRPMLDKWNIVFLDEADAMTPEAQDALRNIMETYAGTCRFILTGNKPSKITAAIKDRCTSIRMEKIPDEEKVAILCHILTSEGYDAENAASYLKAGPSMRHIISEAQKSVLRHGSLEPYTNNTDSVEASQVQTWIASGDFPSILRASKEGKIVYSEILIDLMLLAADASDVKSMAILGEKIHQSSYTPDDAVHFLGSVAALMNA